MEKLIFKLLNRSFQMVVFICLLLSGFSASVDAAGRVSGYIRDEAGNGINGATVRLNQYWNDCPEDEGADCTPNSSQTTTTAIPHPSTGRNGFYDFVDEEGNTLVRCRVRFGLEVKLPGSSTFVPIPNTESASEALNMASKIGGFSKAHAQECGVDVCEVRVGTLPGEVVGNYGAGDTGYHETECTKGPACTSTPTPSPTGPACGGSCDITNTNPNNGCPAGGSPKDCACIPNGTSGDGKSGTCASCPTAGGVNLKITDLCVNVVQPNYWSAVVEWRGNLFPPGYIDAVHAGPEGASGTPFRGWQVYISDQPIYPSDGNRYGNTKVSKYNWIIPATTNLNDEFRLSITKDLERYIPHKNGGLVPPLNLNKIYVFIYNGQDACNAGLQKEFTPDYNICGPIPTVAPTVVVPTAVPTAPACNVDCSLTNDPCAASGVACKCIIPPGGAGKCTTAGCPAGTTYYPVTKECKPPVACRDRCDDKPEGFCAGVKQPGTGIGCDVCRTDTDGLKKCLPPPACKGDCDTRIPDSCKGAKNPGGGSCEVCVPTSPGGTAGKCESNYCNAPCDPTNPNTCQKGVADSCGMCRPSTTGYKCQDAPSCEAQCETNKDCNGVKGGSCTACLGSNTDALDRRCRVFDAGVCKCDNMEAPKNFASGQNVVFTAYSTVLPRGLGSAEVGKIKFKLIKYKTGSDLNNPATKTSLVAEAVKDSELVQGSSTNVRYKSTWQMKLPSNVAKDDTFRLTAGIQECKQISSASTQGVSTSIFDKSGKEPIQKEDSNFFENIMDLFKGILGGESAFAQTNKTLRLQPFYPAIDIRKGCNFIEFKFQK